MPDDHSEVVPLLPIPNRTVKRLCADDSAGSRVKVGHRQAITAAQSPVRNHRALCFGAAKTSFALYCGLPIQLERGDGYVQGIAGASAEAA